MDQGNKVNLDTVVDSTRAQDCGVPHAGELIAFAEAVVMRDDDALPDARGALLAAVGAEGLVDAAGVVGNFERMNRIADAAGIEVDAPVRVLASGIQDELGLGNFASAQHSKQAGPVSKVIARFALPIAARLLARRSE